MRLYVNTPTIIRFRVSCCMVDFRHEHYPSTISFSTGLRYKRFYVGNTVLVRIPKHFDNLFFPYNFEFRLSLPTNQVTFLTKTFLNFLEFYKLSSFFLNISRFLQLSPFFPIEFSSIVSICLKFSSIFLKILEFYQKKVS